MAEPGVAVDVRRRLEAAGWSVTDLREDAVVAEGKPLDVTRGAARRDALRATFVRIGQCVDGDLQDIFWCRRPLVAVARAGTTKLCAEVYDTGRAREEIVALRGLFAASSLEAAIALVEARGFTVDSSASRDDEYDEFNRTIVGRRAGEHLDIYYVFRGSAPASGVVVDDVFGHARMHEGAFTLYVTVRSLPFAEEIVGTLGSKGSQ